MAHPRRRSGTSRRGRERRPHAADKAAPGTRSKTFADIRARTRPVRCLRSLVNERNKKFAGTKPANSRENVDGWLTSGTRSRRDRSRMRTAYRLVPDGTRPEVARSNTIGNKACNRACNKDHSNTVSPRLWRRQGHRSKRSMNHAPTQQVRRQGPLPTCRQGRMQEQFVGTYVSPFPVLIDKRPLGRFRCFLGRSLNHEPKNAPWKQGVDGRWRRCFLLQPRPMRYSSDRHRQAIVRCFITGRAIPR